MTTNVRTLALDDTVEACLKCMKDNRVRHVPVMDMPTDDSEKPYFVGVVSERDIFRRISPYVGKLGQEDTDSTALQMPLVHVVTRNPRSASPGTPMPEMLVSMIDDHVDMLPVLENGDLVGVVTAGDITKLFVRLDAIRQLCTEPGSRTRLVDLAGRSGPEAAALLTSVFRTVQDIMTEQPVSLEQQHSLSDAIEVMRNGRFRHVPIVSQEGELIGIVSDRDVLRHLSIDGMRQHPSEGFRDGLFETDPKDPDLKFPVTRAMRQEVVHVSPDCGIYDAAKTMNDLSVSCLPVVDDQKNLQGMVTVTDLMRALLAAYKLAERAA